MDTYEGDNEDPLSLHKYLYCDASPVNMIDPSGHDGDLASLSVTMGGAATLASQNMGAVMGAENAAEASIVESEALAQTLTEQAEVGMTEARAGLQQAFQAGRTAVGRAFNQFGELAENTANNAIKTVLRNTGTTITRNPPAGNGTRYLDFLLENGKKVMRLEVKYNLPESGAQLTRLAAQVDESVAAGNGQTVVWSLRPPASAAIKAVQKACGANYSQVVFKSGVGDFLTYLKSFF
jgi:hypothetical protein